MKKYFIAALILIVTVSAAVYFSQTSPPQGDDVLLPSAERQTETDTAVSQPPSQTKPPVPSTLPTAVSDEATSGLAGGNSSGTEDPETTTKPAWHYTITSPDAEITTPSNNKDLALFEQIVRGAGFLYDKEQNIFYSDVNPWQKRFGFSSVYDTFAKFGGMIYETRRFKFSYEGHDWLFQVWKGRYGITSGAEMGIYYKLPEQTEDFYSCADAGKYVAMEFQLYKDDKLYMFRGPERHWWLTGFRLGDIVYGNQFVMIFTYYLDSDEMADALDQAIANEGFVKNINYIRDGKNIQVFW
ncbi:MAG: DUF4474 domain-containing protein [Oscillospiraceae bacterium]|jgi:hypothetical protein|nr:DUF4474 domain-containing protein [Oscillospiraceae bacterium]